MPLPLLVEKVDSVRIPTDSRGRNEITIMISYDINKAHDTCNLMRPILMLGLLIA